VDDASAAALEAAIADAGLLLVRLEKYRDPGGAEDLRRRAQTLGDRARRLHHRGALEASAAALLAEARELVAALQGAVGAVHARPSYRDAVAAHARGDAEALVRTLPRIFADLEPAALAGDVFHAVPWRRRGRPRRPEEVAAEITRLRDAGLVAEGNDLAPGVDPDLPAVVLQAGPPEDEPIALRIPASAVTGPAFRFRDDDELLVHVPRLCVPFVVRLRPDLDADALEEAGGLDYGPYRSGVAAALRDAGVPVDPD
jgi:hypothetical protein